jgi:hypothetical protein
VIIAEAMNSFTDRYCEADKLSFAVLLPLSCAVAVAAEWNVWSQRLPDQEDLLPDFGTEPYSKAFLGAPAPN